MGVVLGNLHRNERSTRLVALGTNCFKAVARIGSVGGIVSDVYE